MIYPGKKSLLFVIIILVCSSSPSYAHKVRVFAWAQQDIITVESSFSGGRKMVNGTITVNNEATGDTIISGTTNADGIFTFTLPETITTQGPTLNIMVSGGDGHQAHWIMEPEDYLGARKIARSVPAEKKTFPTISRQTDCSGNEEENAELLDRILEAKLAPIRRDLAALNDPAPNLKDILGGIGYLVGLAGIAAWIQSRKKKC